MAGPKTPVMEQHARAKRAHPEAVVFFRLGDFYEMFGEDAVFCARVLDLTLTSRNKGKPDEVPMAGVPHHAAHGYVKRLLDLGHSVALCEQMADPKTVKGLVPREVTRVLTPGTVTHGEHLEAETNNWLCALDVGPAETGVALYDLSTGELAGAIFPDLAAALGEIARARPREVVVGTSVGDTGLADVEAAVRAAVRGVAVRVDGELLEGAVAELLGALAMDARRAPPAVARSAARALRFAAACNPGRELPLRRFARWDPSACLVIDPVAQRHLELVDAPAGRAATLLGVLDETRTPAGARRLRRRLLAPSADLVQIRRRLDQVEVLVEDAPLRAAFRAELRGVGDVERLATRAVLGEATPRDLGALRDGLRSAAAAVRVLEAVSAPNAREILGLGPEPFDVAADVAGGLETALVERPPAQAKEGAIFRTGYDAELDEQASLAQHGAERMTELEARLRAQTDIPTLKVRYTRVFGWYIEVNRSHVAKVPHSWRRKQTVATGERYTVPELDDLADRITQAEERHREIELRLLGELCDGVRRESHRLTALGERLARWDVSAALAEVAHRYDYRRPEVDDSTELTLVDARHPVVERLAAEGRFVPNDVRLDVAGERLWIVTGPNMAGKSTLLRQTALTVILAQMGSFVPARSAHIGLVDRVLSRVGASDDLARGESTFMVEMRETAEILRTATRRSVVILDEIGRGTSTFDGLAIAWAVAEYLDEVVSCRTLFATHYHELTALARSSAHIENVSVSAQEVEGDVVFLHRLVRGPASRSYGVAVAKLAGLPESVLARSRALLESLEAGGAATGASRRARTAAPTPQLDLFTEPRGLTPEQQEVLATLRALDVDQLTPLEALTLLARLKRRI
jgi:DNA mismatch repair protein MutS